MKTCGMIWNQFNKNKILKHSLNIVIDVFKHYKTHFLGR